MSARCASNKDCILCVGRKLKLNLSGKARRAVQSSVPEIQKKFVLLELTMKDPNGMKAFRNTKRGCMSADMVHFGEHSDGECGWVGLRSQFWQARWVPCELGADVMPIVRTGSGASGEPHWPFFIVMSELRMMEDWQDSLGVMTSAMHD